ncbi:hypothetical protein JCM19037_2364 [Geomicrobium sp. JCM 19037]|uniref:alpha/beta hydrolase n=1 Tax=Geomicrobium sp. JCM 19037 TaxID=1460634 RepID=UPI00045F2D82|nr:alpha/beta hydrolase [Geomicrobium sp. JCM 19037]GAK03994.1 hypothetical protein JCM19037_2364 [Geomicrobium sp. JCM 19037]
MKHFFHKSTDHPHTFVLLHGSGGRESDLLSVVGEIDVRQSVLGIRGSVRDHGGFRHFERQTDGKFDREEINQRTEEVLHVIEDYVQHNQVNRKHIHLLGYSNGANLAVNMILQQPELFSSALLFHPSHLYPEAERSDLSGMPIFMTSGSRDAITPPGEAYALRQQLETFGADVTVELTDHGHELTNKEVDIAASWWNKGLASH